MKTSIFQEQEILESILLYYYNINNLDISNMYLFKPAELIKLSFGITAIIDKHPAILDNLYNKSNINQELKNLIDLKNTGKVKSKFFDEDLIDSNIKDYIKYDFILMYIDYCYKNWSYIINKILSNQKSVVTLLNIDCFSPNTSVLLLHKELTLSLFNNYVIVKSNLHRI